MYLMQKYWARKPHNVVAAYINRYSSPGEIVLDPFVGSGVTLIESLRLKRKAIGIDLDPFSILLTEVTVQGTDLDKLDEEFESIKKDLQSRINRLYQVPCPKCDKKGIIRYVVWSYAIVCPICRKRIVMANAKRPKGKRQNIYKCPSCRQEFSYANLDIAGEDPISLKMYCPDCKKDYEIDTPDPVRPRIELSSIWYPKIKFMYNENRPFATRRRATTIEELYTERNLHALAIINDRILKIKDKNLLQAFKFIFVSMVPQASKMMIYTEKSGPSWKVPEYLILPVHCEFNVWSRFENRFRGIRRGLEDSIASMPSGLTRANAVNEFFDGSDYWLFHGNAIELHRNIPPNSVDYVFTDPPYGGAVQYFELDLIRVAWLTENDATERWWKEEITVNRGQGKNFEYYHKMLTASFAQIYQVLKPGRFLTVTFHSTDIDVWNSIIIAVRLAGFDLEKIIYQPPAVRSAKASLQPYGSAVGDYYIRFRKLEQKREIVEEPRDIYKYRRIVVETAKKIIAERGEPTPYTFILNGIIPELDKQGVFFVDKRGSKGIDEVLRDRMNVDFVLKPIVGKLGEVLGQGWWLKDPSSIPYLETVPLSERVEKLVINILNRRVKVSYDDVLQEVFITFPNALTPNTQSVKEVLDEYASQTPDGNWMLKPKFKEQMDQHDTIVWHLTDLGMRFGFDVHADIDGYRKTVFPFDVENQDRVKEIDVIWYSGKKVVAVFEIENTTGITEAIVRSGNIIDESALRVLVMPKERNRLLRRRIHEPILREQIVRRDWRLLSYEDLAPLVFKRRTTFDAMRAKMVRLTDFKPETQERIDKFLSRR